MRNGCILCGGTGSGKSVVGIAYYISRMCEGSWLTCKMKKPKNLYIITTAMKRDRMEWDTDLGRFGLSRDRECCLFPVNITVDSWNNIHKYTKVSGAAFIFDEQRVVGSGAWAKAFQAIVKKNQWILLSATPGDTWSDYIQVFIANGFYKNKTEFSRRHCVYSRYCTRYPKVEGYREQEYLLSLRDRLLVQMDCVRSTERHTFDRVVPYDLAMYKDASKRRWNVYKDAPARDISELCYVLRRISNSHPGRIAEVVKLVKDHGRCLIFYNFDYELELLEKMCKKEKFMYGQWNGHVHEPLPTGTNWVYLVQYTAGSEGWNCTQCNTVIFFSQSYSYKQTEQASGRIERLDTPYKDLYYYHLRSSSKIDIAIRRALLAKKQFNEAKYMAKFTKNT
jgi:hypothetical protein